MKIRTLVGLLGISSLSLSLACSGGEDADSGAQTPIASGPMSGVVGGQSWVLTSAETDAFLSEGEPTFWADLYAQAFTPCSASVGPDGHHLILNVPRSPGDHPLSLSLNATFVVEGATATIDNLVATKGHIVVDEVTATSIRGGAYIDFDAANTVNGHFEIAICPD